jgi:hypothetical protein
MRPRSIVPRASRRRLRRARADVATVRGLGAAGQRNQGAPGLSRRRAGQGRGQAPARRRRGERDDAQGRSGHAQFRDLYRSGVVRRGPAQAGRHRGRRTADRYGRVVSHARAARTTPTIATSRSTASSTRNLRSSTARSGCGSSGTCSASSRPTWPGRCSAGARNTSPSLAGQVGVAHGSFDLNPPTRRAP